MADFTIADVLAWARTKPADERYDFTDSSTCAIAQFGIATGRPALTSLLTAQIDRLHPQLTKALVGNGGPDTWTFGALVNRLEAIAPKAVAPRSDWSRLDAYLTDIETVSA